MASIESTAQWISSRRSLLSLDMVILLERRAEIEHVAEVIHRIVIGLLQPLRLDEREHDAAEVERAGHVPPPQNRLCQQPPLQHRIAAKTFAELLTGDVS